MTKIKNLIHIIIGIILIIIGIVGLVLPILNGIIFLLLGAILISFQSPYVEQGLNKIASKNTHLAHWYEKLNSFIRKIFG